MGNKKGTSGAAIPVSHHATLMKSFLLLSLGINTLLEKSHAYKNAATTTLCTRHKTISFPVMACTLVLPPVGTALAAPVESRHGLVGTANLHLSEEGALAIAGFVFASGWRI
jgi:hypothetical protein